MRFDWSLIWRLFGVAWTVLLFVRFRSTDMTPASDLSIGALYLVFGPLISLVIVFLWLRAGAIPAFITLAISTALSFGTASGDMKDAPMAFAIIAMAFGSFIALIVGAVVALSRRQPPGD